MSNVTLAELTATNLVIVAGKGGVGKTTVTAVLARAAADAGRRVLVVELDGKSTLDDLVPDLDVQHMAAADLLEEYLDEHGFKRIAKRLASTGVIDVIGTAAPGIDDLVVLGKIKQLERSGTWDLVVVDGPAAGHAITFLTAAPGLLDAVRSGPVRDQATDVQEMLGDRERCQVVLVTLPETTPVNELIETSYAIEERVGVRLGPIVVNRVDTATELPDPEAVSFGRARTQVDDAIAAARFRRERVAGAARRARPSERRRAAPTGSARRPVDRRGRPGRRRRARSWIDPVSGLDTVVGDAGVVVCCGSGGVGKTTTAAVIGIEAARRGRRVVVVTIDPARRLADALGLPDGLSGTPQLIPLEAVGEGGELWAMMLDTPAMFDRVVRAHAEDAEQADRIVDNRFYQNIAGALSGTQEYMASEALHELHGDGRFDLVVVDTPPSRNALDFLEAPGVLSGSSITGRSSC